MAAGDSFGRREGVAMQLVDEASRMQCLHIVFCSDVDTHLWQKRTRAILATWGARADKLVFVADIARRKPAGQDSAHGADEGAVANNGPFVRSHARALVHEEVLVPPPALAGQRTEQRVWAMREAYRKWGGGGGGGKGHDRARYTFFAFSNDNVYWVEENLRSYLGTLASAATAQNPNAAVPPLYLGHRLRDGGGIVFNSGASFVLSAAALRLFVGQLDAGTRGAGKAAECTQRGLPDDLLLAECLRQAPVPVLPTDTRDAHGGERFNAFGPIRTARGDVHDWYSSYSWYGLKKGVACCARDVVAFHYVEAAEVRALDALLHRAPPYDRADTLDATQLAQHWPSDWNELGGYSAVPDAAKDAGADGVWELLVRKVALGGIQGRCYARAAKLCGAQRTQAAACQTCLHRNRQALLLCNVECSNGNCARIPLPALTRAFCGIAR